MRNFDPKMLRIVFLVAIVAIGWAFSGIMAAGNPDIHLAGVLGLAAEIIIFLVIAILSYVLIPKPKPTTPEAPDPYGIDEFKVPTASAGREIPVVFGTRWIDSPNVVWYGHLRVEEKKEKTCT